MFDPFDLMIDLESCGLLLRQWGLLCGRPEYNVTTVIEEVAELGRRQHERPRDLLAYDGLVNESYRTSVIAMFDGMEVQPDHRYFLKIAVPREYPVDNSRRGVCNRGRNPSIGLDGASGHAHHPATHRQRLRRLLRAVW